MQRYAKHKWAYYHSYSTGRGVVLESINHESNVRMHPGTYDTPWRICPRALAAERAHPNPCDCGPNADHGEVALIQHIPIVGGGNPPSLSRPLRCWYYRRPMLMYRMRTRLKFPQNSAQEVEVTATAAIPYPQLSLYYLAINTREHHYQ